MRHFKWKMLATEKNFEDFQLAIQNSTANCLYNDIKLVQPQNEDQIFVLENDSQNYFFSLCNPPFYDPDLDRRNREDFETEAGRQHEIACQGGEVEFVSKMIDQSVDVSQKGKN